jgi:hypothetical protein
LPTVTSSTDWMSWRTITRCRCGPNINLRRAYRHPFSGSCQERPVGFFGPGVVPVKRIAPIGQPVIRP